MRPTTMKRAALAVAVTGATLAGVLLVGQAGQAAADVGQDRPVPPAAAQGAPAAADQGPADNRPDRGNRPSHPDPQLQAWEQCLRDHGIKWDPAQRPPHGIKWDPSTHRADEDHKAQGDRTRAPLGGDPACPRPH